VALCSWHLAGDMRVWGSNPGRGSTPTCPTLAPLATFDPGLPQNAQKKFQPGPKSVSND